MPPRSSQSFFVDPLKTATAEDLGAFQLHLTATGIQPSTINARPKFLKAGDVVKLRIENIGTLTNHIS